MKVKVIDENSVDFQKEFKVRRLNYDQVVVTYPNSEGIKVMDNNEVEFITEGAIDEFLVKYNYFLKIRLNRGISVALYKALLEIIEEDLERNIETFDLLQDKYSINKRGIWEKELLCSINNIPYKIVASGQKFKKKGFKISLNRMSKEEFLDICTFEIKKIAKEIKEKEKLLSIYGKAIKLMDTSVEQIPLIQ